MKLGRSCAYVKGKDAIDEEIYKLMEKVAFSTAHGWHSEIYREMIHNPYGITVEKLAEALQISISSVQRRLVDLQELKIVVSEKIKKGKAGRPTNLWKVTDDMRQHWENASVSLKRIKR